jgi:hypothetical protein
VKGAFAGGLVALGLVAALVWGCASSMTANAPPHDWQHYAPDGGWVTYVPERRVYEPNPMEAAGGINAPMSPILPVVPSGNPASPFP